MVGTLSLSACAEEAGDGGAESIATVRASLTFAERSAACAADPRVVAGLVSQQVCVGADLFFRETFDGNGRTCATCHRVENNYTIDPAFIATLPQSDPLFVAENDPNLATLENSAELRRAGLVHENVDGFEDPDNEFVLRSSQHILALAVSVTRPLFPQDNASPPQDRTGWSGDGAPGAGRLKDFATGAVTQHFTKSISRVPGTDFRLPTEEELDALAAFQRTVGRVNDITLPEVLFSDAQANAGKGTFANVVLTNGAAPGGCPRCHGGAGANVSGVNRTANTGVESSRSAALAGFPVDGGFLTSPVSSDGGRGTGVFNVPPLIEAADTGPFFHTDTTISGASGFNAPSAETIEQAIAFYDTPAFNNSPAAGQGKINDTVTQIQNIGRFLRAINANMNLRMTIKRLDGARSLAVRDGDGSLSVQTTLLSLAREELDDAVAVLAGAAGGPLNATQQTQLATARTAIADAIAATTATARIGKIDDAKSTCNTAASGIGTGMAFTIGEGTLMF
jgi:cytochrome c peroxidase